MFWGLPNDSRGSSERSKSPNVVCTSTNPPWLPLTTNPISAETATLVIADSWPVSAARGVGQSADSPTIVCVRAFQCQRSTVQSSEPKKYNYLSKSFLLSYMEMDVKTDRKRCSNRMWCCTRICLDTLRFQNGRRRSAIFLLQVWR